MTNDPFTETIISDPYAHAHELAVRPGRDADEVRLDATGHGRTVTIVVPAVELRAALDRAAALTEPPARPAGAEELGELIGTWTATEGIAPAQLPTGSLATLADFLAERGVRVVGEDGAA